jgi:hypothetical protein
LWRAPGRMHAAALTRPSLVKGGLEERFQAHLALLDLSDQWPMVSRLTKQGKHRAARPSKESLKAKVKAASARWLHSVERFRDNTGAVWGNTLSYGRIAGGEIFRHNSLYPEQWIFSTRSPAALQKTLERRTQGSRDIASHFPWVRVHDKEVWVAYADRHCAHCKALGKISLGDEAHWLFDCPVATIERDMVSARVRAFFMEHPLKWEEEDDDIMWDSDTLPLKDKVGLLLGSTIPDGMETTTCTPLEWMQKWTVLADVWTMGMGRVDRSDANTGDG